MKYILKYEEKKRPGPLTKVNNTYLRQVNTAFGIPAKPTEKVKNRSVKLNDHINNSVSTYYI